MSNISAQKSVFQQFKRIALVYLHISTRQDFRCFRHSFPTAPKRNSQKERDNLLKNVSEVSRFASIIYWFEPRDLS